MEKGKDPNKVKKCDANLCQSNTQNTCSEKDDSSKSSLSSIHSEDIDAIFNELSTATPIVTTQPNGDVICNIEAIEDETASNVLHSIDLPNAASAAANQENGSHSSLPSLNSIVCRICHNAENPDKLVSPCNCRGTSAYVHIYCLERWITTSRFTTCELCHFQYRTEQSLRYNFLQSLRIYYSRHVSRRLLQEDCEMFSVLTLVAFGIIGTLLVGLQYYLLQGNIWGTGRVWTKGWLLFFIITTLAIYMVNLYLLAKSQILPWYRWWQSTRDIKLIVENRKPYLYQHIQNLQRQQVDAGVNGGAFSSNEGPPVISTNEEEHPDDASNNEEANEPTVSNNTTPNRTLRFSENPESRVTDV